MDARGGILEPPGIVEVKYRAPQQAWLLDRLGGSQVQGNEALYGKKKRNWLVWQFNGKSRGWYCPLRLTNHGSSPAQRHSQMNFEGRWHC